MKLRALSSIFVLFFCFCAGRAQEAENNLTTADQRRIIEILLTDKFSGAKETIYISTANLKKDIQKDFPFPANIKVQFVSPRKAADSELCAYEFGEFQVIDKFVSVSFGNCRDGLAYDFIKSKAGWKSVSSTVTRQILY